MHVEFKHAHILTVSQVLAMMTQEITITKTYSAHSLYFSGERGFSSSPW